MLRTVLAILGALIGSAPLIAQVPVAPMAGEPIVPMYETPPEASWRYWARGEYLLWSIRGDHVPLPWTTTGPAAAPGAGAVGEPTTSVLIGPDLNYKFVSGGKLWLGFWLDNEATLGIDGSGFCLESHTIHEKSYSNRTNGAPLIARPFFNLLTGLQDAQVVTAPGDALGGSYIGGVGVFDDSRTWGGELNLRFNLGCAAIGSLDLLAGFRYLGQKDELRSDQSSLVLSPGTVGFGGVPAPAPDIVSVRDFLVTTNNFYGGQLGLDGRIRRGAWLLEAGARVGLGGNDEHLQAVGRSLLTDSAGVNKYLPGGLLVPQDQLNLGRRQLSFMAEFNLRLGYQLGEHWVVSAGYTYLYWGNLIRPGGQINAAIDPRQVPTSLSYVPGFPASTLQLHSTDFWAQGLTFALECRY
jgi:hypothetical protein